MIVEGETPARWRSPPAWSLELPTVFENLGPDIVVSVGDRFETMATAVAAAYMNIPVAHTMGGEISGTIDESIRHAVTKLAHVHFPANAKAAERILRMGEDPATVHVVGCPRVDLVAEIVRGDGQLGAVDWLEREGRGPLTLDEPFLWSHTVTRVRRWRAADQRTMSAAQGCGCRHHDRPKPIRLGTPRARHAQVRESGRPLHPFLQTTVDT